LLEKLFSDPSLQKFKEEVLASSSLLIENLWDTPKALLTVLLWKATGKNILIISGKKEDRFLDALSFFGKEALDFLPWETLPGEEIPPSLDISGQRLDILYKLAKKKKGHIVHCPVQSLMQKTVSKKKLIPLCLSLKKGEETSFEALPELLTNLGYIRTPVASDKGAALSIFSRSRLRLHIVSTFSEIPLKELEPMIQLGKHLLKR
jgi:transcription-repair coupling factor (superfamily II helicase)